MMRCIVECRIINFANSEKCLKKTFNIKLKYNKFYIWRYRICRNLFLLDTLYFISITIPLTVQCHECTFCTLFRVKVLRYLSLFAVAQFTAILVAGVADPQKYWIARPGSVSEFGMQIRTLEQKDTLWFKKNWIWTPLKMFLAFFSFFWTFTNLTVCVC